MANNPKSRLQTVLQKKLKRSLKKEDMAFETTECEGGFQTTISLPCDENQSFVGPVGGDAKEAESNALEAALEHYSGEIPDADGASKNKKRKKPASQQPSSAMAAPTPPLKKQKMPDMNPNWMASMPPAFIQMAQQMGFLPSGGQFNAAPQAGGPAKTQLTNSSVTCNKNQLNALMAKIKKGPTPKSEIIFECEEVAHNGSTGYQSTLKLPTLPGFEQIEFAGEPADSQKQADQNAAGQAIQMISEQSGIPVAPAGKPAAVSQIQFPPQPPAKKKKSGKSSGSPVPAGVQNSSPHPTADCKKNKLQALIAQVIRGPVTKNQVLYEKSQVMTKEGPGFQCTLKVLCLPGYESTEFTGEPSLTEREADQNAAGQAIDLINEDASLQQLIANAVEAKNKKKQEALEKKKTLETS